ncbi:MAG: hypothetical protein LBL84_01460 [Candidatus Nomurabacteria bacterium]|jgi:hypothetical protein|nr:hypothetical protein [Candidatus Nomurabacteria bacterium]
MTQFSRYGQGLPCELYLEDGEGPLSITKSVLIIVYGEWGIDSPWFENAKSPREGYLAEHRTIEVFGGWHKEGELFEREPRPRGEVLDFLVRAQALAQAVGWQIVNEAEDANSTGAIYFVTVDSTIKEEDRANLASNFRFKCEMPEIGFDHSETSIAELEQLAQQVLDLL